MKKDISKKELHKIAKTIQWHYKAGLASMYRKAFSCTRAVARYDNNKRYELRMAIEDSLTPSNKLHDSTKVKEILSSLHIYQDQDEYRYITFLTGFKLPSLKTITSDLRVLMNDFNGMDFSNDNLSVEMGPFELDGVHFGNFTVTFDIDDSEPIEKLTFSEFPEPTSVLVNNREWNSNNRE